MRVLVPQKSLAETLAAVERVVPSRSSNPGMNLVKVDIGHDGLVMSGSNMDVDIRAEVAADVTTSSQEGSPDGGSYAVTAQLFAQVVRSLPGDEVTIEFGETEMHLTSGHYDTKLQLMSAGAAPELTFPTRFAGEVDAEELSRALRAVRYAAAVADFQAVFRGVKFEFTEAGMRTVATDGFRLAYYATELSTGLTGDIIVPAQSVDELLRVLGSGEALLELGDSELSVLHRGVSLNLKLMDGTFPDYERVIPTDFPVSVTLNPSTLAESLARVAVVTDRSSNNRVDLFVKNGQLLITAEGGYGRSQEALAVEQEGSESEIRLSYNSKYLIDALTPIRGDARLRFSGSSSRASVLNDLGDPGYLAMVVPLKLD